MKEMAPEDRLRSANARVGNAQFKLGLAKARRLETRHWERELRDALADRAAALAALADAPGEVQP